MIGPGRPCPRKTRRPRSITGASRHQSSTPRKTTAGNTGNTGNLLDNPSQAFFGNDLKGLGHHCSNPRRLPETWRKPAETGGYSLQKHASSAGLASGIAPSAKIL